MRASASARRKQSVSLEVTERDQHMLRWIGRCGLCTSQQIASRWFVTEQHPEGAQSATNQRLAKLERAGYLRRERTLATASSVTLRVAGPSIVRLTRAGSDLVDAGLPPMKLSHARVAHTIALVDLLSELQRQYPEATIVTERELRAQRVGNRDRYGRRPGEGRTPDGLLIFPDGNGVLRRGTTAAIELDLTQKADEEYERLIAAYKLEDADAVWWYCPSRVVARRLRAIVTDRGADDFIDVRERPA